MKRVLLATSIAFPMAIGVMGLNCGGGTVTPPPQNSSSSSGGTSGSSGSGSGASGSSSGNTGSSSGATGSSSGDTGSSSGASGSGSGSSSGATGSSSGSSGGSSGSSSGSSSSSSGAGGDGGAGPMDVLNNQQWLLPCGPDQSYSKLVCVNQGLMSTMYGGHPGGNPCPNAALPYIGRGTMNRDQTVTVGGNPATTYMVTAHFRGVVEPKTYQGGTKQMPTVKTDGWYIGGTPSANGDYNVYLLTVTNPNPAANPTVTYYLNALANQNPVIRESHFSYLIDYMATFPIQGGATVRFASSDSNCSAIKNCDVNGSVDVNPGGVCVPIVVPNFNVTPPIAQPYNGQFVVMELTNVSPAQ